MAGAARRAGAGQDCLESLGDPTVDRSVVFYDQLGRGRSGKPDNPALRVIDRFVAELVAVRRASGLRRYHLYGVQRAPTRRRYRGVAHATADRSCTGPGSPTC
ncbi:hypothetical protein [Streptomyces sp. NBC_00986]|uniref:hypothetical protein n=1 Tax=Streptomyces sp. NBC_00986 TaxID=2903702 RepID=UPI0038659E27|nr:hypothetical protein OG504_37540 [Streptomyces sp. NBC_00986]